MNLLLKSAVIVDPSSKHHMKERDVLIENGTIVTISNNISNKGGSRELALENLHISPGWFDSSVSFGEPGFEERETLENGLRTAGLSGFAHVAVNANTNPVTDSKSDIKFLKAKAEGHAVSLYPIGSLTMGGNGENLAELYDMKNAGAVGFYDFKKPIRNANLLRIALQYTQSFDGLVQSFPFDPSVAKNGLVNEEATSTRLGLKGIPALSETLQISRDLFLLEYTGGKLHIPTISTKKSVALIREAKRKGLQVTCSVSAAHLSLTDNVLEEFDTRYKILPPLRTNDDVEALVSGLKDGTIDGITSDHDPIDIENKKVEFDHALFGSIGLESCFGATQKALGLETTIASFEKLKATFGIKRTPIEEGEMANITLFNPTLEYDFTEKEILSTSKNAALLGNRLRGKAYGIFANNTLLIRE
ncbi:MAG: dihydroorotase [Flavobacteriaceae bacterium]|nr:dihydroorotase [Flavobacteriaceae bacterium]